MGVEFKIVGHSGPVDGQYEITVAWWNADSDPDTDTPDRIMPYWVAAPDANAAEAMVGAQCLEKQAEINQGDDQNFWGQAGSDPDDDGDGDGDDDGDGDGDGDEGAGGGPGGGGPSGPGEEDLTKRRK